MRLKYQLLAEPDTPPWSLLLDADPSRVAVKEYLRRGQCYCVYLKTELVGQFVLMETEVQTVEIMNIAVAPDRQRQGVGSALLSRAQRIAEKMRARCLFVGTGNCNFEQLAFYQKNGFRIVGVWPDYFKHRYRKKYSNAGIELSDMIRLKKVL